MQNAELKKVQNISRQWITAGILWLSTKGKPELLLPRTRFADTVDKNPGTRKISGGSKSKTEQDQWIDSEKKLLRIKEKDILAEGLIGIMSVGK